MAIVLMALLGAVVGMATGVGMVRHPDRPPLGWRLGSLPDPARMRFLGWVIIVCAVIAACFGLLLAVVGL